MTNWNTLNQKQHEELPIQNGEVWINQFSNLFGQIKKFQEQKHIHDNLEKFSVLLKLAINTHISLLRAVG
jgi:hypothetical protein